MQRVAVDEGEGEGGGEVVAYRGFTAVREISLSCELLNRGKTESAAQDKNAWDRHDYSTSALHDCPTRALG